MEKLITVCKVGATRGYRTLFSDLSFSVDGGEVLELRGENGSGKSTLLRILAGLTRPDAGSVDYFIEASTSQNSSFYPVHFLGHQDGIKAQESVEAQIMFWTKFFGEDVSKVRPALERVGLWKRRDVPGRGLSAGQRRRLSLARLLVSYRPIWLLDEPLAALDAKGRDIALELIEEHTKKDGAVIAAMHGEGFKNARTVDICSPSKAESKSNKLLDDLI